MELVYKDFSKVLIVRVLLSGCFELLDRMRSRENKYTGYRIGFMARSRGWCVENTRTFLDRRLVTNDVPQIGAGSFADSHLY